VSVAADNQREGQRSDGGERRRGLKEPVEWKQMVKVGFFCFYNKQVKVVNFSLPSNSSLKSHLYAVCKL